MATPPSAGTRTRLGPPIRRSEIIERAESWLRPSVPYSANKFHHNEFGIFRTDCSGYVSMALQLPKPGPNTVGLATSTYTKSITMAGLKQGDLVIDSTGTSTTRHVVIFDKWTSTAHTRYWVYEQEGGVGTAHDEVSYGLGGDQYHPYRPVKY